MIWTIIGTTAAILTTLAFIPQIIKVLRTKSASDVSPITLVQFSIGVTLWLIYGLHIKDTIVVAANGVTLVNIIILLRLYFKYR
jgi:MtN3 and saliva related transmembrane protein